MEVINSMMNYEAERAWKEKAISEQGSLENETITEQKNGAIKEQESRQLIEALRIRNNRIYYECLNTAEKVLTRYISPYKKPLRFLNVFAGALYEKRTKHSVAAYHGFLEAKIREVQWRNARFPRYQAPKLPWEKYEGRIESYWR